MKNIFLEAYKKNDKYSAYDDIAADMDFTRSGAWRAINEPWRTKFDTMMKLAKLLGMDELEAMKFWKKCKLEKKSEILEKLNT